MSWPQIKKNCLEVSSSLVLHSNELFLDQIVTCNENWIVYNSWWQPAQQLDWEKALKSFPKPNLHQEKGHGHCLVVCCWSDSLQLSFFPAKPLHLRSMLSKLLRCTKNCGTCSQHWSTERAQLFSVTVPSHMLYKQCFKRWTNWATKSSLIYTRFTWALANWLPLLWASWQIFAGKMLPQPAGHRKCFPRVHRILKHWFFFCCKNKCISCWQKYVDCNGSYFD